jgi:BlaI family penicillinase repressor
MTQAPPPAPPAPPSSVTPSITELALLKALWKQAPMSARELHARVEAELGWSFSSTRKTLDRMLDKEMVSQHSRSGVLAYEPRLDKVATLAAFAHDFACRIMEIDSPLPASMFTGSKLVDARELAELDRLLQDWPSDGRE